MKIADYGKAITSYIESPTTAQKLKSKKLAGLMEEYLGDQLDYQKAVDEGFQGTEEEYRRYKSTSEEDRTFLADGTPFDFSGLSVPQLKLLYKRYTGTDGPSDPKQLISELKRLIKGLDEDGIPFATGGRVHLAEGSEDIVEPSKSMQVDTTTKPLPLFTLDDFKFKANTYVGALYNGALPAADIKAALNKFTQKGIDDGTFTADDAIKVVQDLKFQFQDRAQKQRLRDVIIEGTGTVEREDFVDGGEVKYGPNKGKYLLNYVEDGKKLKKIFDTKKEFEEFAKKRRNLPRKERGSYSGVSDKPLSKQKFTELYEKFLKSKKLNKTDRAFAEVLNKKGFKTQTNDPFTSDGVSIRRARYGIKGVTVQGGPPPEVKEKINKINNYLDELIPKLNSENKFYTGQDVRKMVIKKFKLPANTQLDVRSYPNLKVDSGPNSLFSRAKKIDEVINRALASDKPLGSSLTQYLKNETGLDLRRSDLDNSTAFQSIKNQGGDLLRYRLRALSELYNLSLSDALTRALDVKKGQPIFTGLGKEKYFSSSPKHKVMEFAIRSWNANKGKGNIKFIDSKGNEITWKRGTKLPYRKVSFKYNGKLYNMSKLDDIEFLKKEFPEVYKKQIAVNRLRAIEVDNPFKKGTTIPLLDLVRLNSQKIYGWKSKRNTFDILHGKRGVAFEPFTNLSFNSRDVNQMQLGVDTSVRAGKINQSDANKILKFINEYTGSGNVEKIKQRQISLTNDFLAGKVDSYGAERDRILSAAKSIDAVKKYAASQGIKLNSFAGFLDFTQAGIDLPPAIKQASENILKASGQVLKGGGKLAVVLDPIFAAQDFSKAIDTGVSGGEALSFTAQKFAQDLMNLPRTLEDLAYTATEKGTFKNFGDKENRIFDYKPKTFADDFLKNRVEKTDPKILKARLAKRDFDTQVLPNLTMVDDIDIPASKEEIGAAKDAFMQEKDVDLSVLEKPKKTPFGKYNEQIKKLVF